MPRRLRHNLARFVGYLAAVLLAAPASAALDASAWRHRQPFDLPSSGLTKIALPVDTLDLSRPHLGDLRLLDPNGNETPFLVEIPHATAATTINPASFRVRLDRRTTEITLTTGTDTPVEAIELTTGARAFVKAARIETSLDAQTWQLLADGVPFSRTPDVTSAPLLRLPSATSAAHLRITLDDERTPPLAFNDARLFLSATDSAPRIRVETTHRRDEFLRETVLTVDLGARNFTLADISLEVADPLFAREVRLTQPTLHNGEAIPQTLAAATFQRGLHSDGTARELLRLPIDAHIAPRELQLRIANADNPPLRIRKLTVHRRPAWLVFHAATPGTYTLLTGHPLAPAPTYDLTHFAAAFRSVSPTDVAFSPVQPNPDFRRTDALADTPLLGASVNTADWSFQKPVTRHDPGVQQLELDLDILAHAQPSLADLRLVHDTRQVPFILERTGLFRPLALEPISTDSPDRPQHSRWKLTLPRAQLPIERLTLESSAVLFSRPIHVFELVPDRRGELTERPLASRTTWTRTPGQPSTPIALELHTRPLTDVLYVEIDNADNAPLALTTATAALPVSRLLFRAPDGDISLFYGNPDARTPAYDLALAANQLLHDERSPVTVGRQLPEDAKPRRLLTMGPLLWIALTLVVATLLYVVAHLLPKPPPAT